MDKQLSSNNITDIVGPIVKDKEAMENIDIKEKNNQPFLDAIKGYVSYIKFPMSDKVDVKEMLRGSDAFKDLSLYISEMEEPQKNAYAISRRIVEGKESFRLNEQYASIFSYKEGDKIIYKNSLKGNIDKLLKVDSFVD